MRPFAMRLSSPLLEDHDHAECGGAWGAMTNQLRRSRWQQLRYFSEYNNSRGTSSNEGWLTMGDKISERKGLLWWIEHESTNEFYYCALRAGDVFLGHALHRCSQMRMAPRNA